MQLPLFSQDLCWQAVQHNENAKNRYGRKAFRVIHSGGITSKWSANNLTHLNMLLNIEKKLGYITSVDKITCIEN